MPPGSVPLFRADNPKISAYLAHLVHVGDEMAAGLGALFAEKFPEGPALAVIHEGFQFSKNDSLLLFAGLDGDALTLAKTQAEGGTAAEMINRVGRERFRTADHQLLLSDDGVARGRATLEKEGGCCGLRVSRPGT